MAPKKAGMPPESSQASGRVNCVGLCGPSELKVRRVRTEDLSMPAPPPPPPAPTPKATVERNHLPKLSRKKITNPAAANKATAAAAAAPPPPAPAPAAAAAARN